MTKYTIDEAWLRGKYCDEILPVEEIAKRVGCSVANIKKHLKMWKLLRGKELQRRGTVPAWNKGLTKNTDERMKLISEGRMGADNPMAGKTPWNKGLGLEDVRVAAVADKARGRKHDDETKEKMRQAKLGKYGELANNWQGGTSYLNGYGVHRRTVCGRRMYAHRYVAEKALCRRLSSEEKVHHVDRDRGNNDPDNLIVLADADHLRLHRAISKGFTSKAQQVAWLLDNEIHFEVLV